METASSVTATRPSLGLRTAEGAAWTIGFSLGGKAISVLTQIAIAWLLMPGDLGLAAMTLSVAGIVSVVAGTNLSTLLIQAKDGFIQRAGQVFWLAIVMNMVGSLILLSFAPFSSAVFGDTRVEPLIVVMAIGSPLMALGTIYSASLYRELHFRAISTIIFATGLLQNVLSLVLAAAGWGAYSLILPLLGTALFSAVLYRRAAGRIPLPGPDPRQWTGLVLAAVWLLINSLFNAVRNYGTSFAISVAARDTTVTGLYYWGNAVAFQAVFLLASNLQGVFFPALSKLNDDPPRQFSAFRKAAGVLGLFAVVTCAIQIVSARPLISLIFDSRWERGIPVVQWLSVAVLTQPLNTLAAAVLLALGRFKSVAAATAVSGAVVTAAALAGASYGKEKEIAEWTALAMLVTNVAPAWIVYRHFGRGLSLLVRDFVPLLLVGIPGVLLSKPVVLAAFGPLVQVAAICLVVIIASACASRCITPLLFREILNRGKNLSFPALRS